MQQHSFRGPVESVADAIDVIVAYDLDVVAASALHATDDVATMILIARGRCDAGARDALAPLGWRVTDASVEALAAVA